jgi:hypothetical protein
MLALAEIGAQCRAHGAVQTLHLLDPAAVTGLGRAWLGRVLGNITASESAVRVRFTQGQGSYRSVANASEDGLRYTNEVSVTVSRGQIEVDGLLRRLQDKTVHVFFTDAGGQRRVMLHARVRPGFQIPDTLGGRQQYDITFTLTDAAPARIYTGSLP